MSNAEAWITGEYPNQKLNLKLPTGATGPQGPVGPIGPASTVPGPANELTVLDTVTGPETAGATGPQGVKGDKGDPGGIVLGTALGTSDLNSIITAGTYYQSDAATGTLARNYPKDVVAGNLVVFQAASSNLLKQVFYPINGAFQGKLFYVRQYNTNAWTAWAAYGSNRVDQTAGRAIYQWDDVNNREQRIYGDTGWRDVSADLINGATVTSTLKIRRQNDTVSMQVVNLKLPSTAIGDPWYLIPTGFSGVQTFGMLRETVNTGLAFGFSTTTHAMLYGVISSTPANNTTHRFTGALNWHTDQAWPTTLPGIAAGTIQNA